MATNIPSATLQADQEISAALRDIAAYQPANPAYALAAVLAAQDAMTTARNTEVQLQARLAAARDTTEAAEAAFHNLILGVKDQVIAQFGRDSNEAQAVGLTKKSERKSPARRAASKPAA